MAWLWGLIVVLVVLWLLGFFASSSAGTRIHILLVLAVSSSSTSSSPAAAPDPTAVGTRPCPIATFRQRMHAAASPIRAPVRHALHDQENEHQRQRATTAPMKRYGVVDSLACASARTGTSRRRAARVLTPKRSAQCRAQRTNRSWPVSSMPSCSDLEGAMALVTEDMHRPHPGARHPAGPRRVRAFLSGFFSAFPEQSVAVHEMIAEGDRVLVRHTHHAVHGGEFAGLPPTGIKTTVDGLWSSSDCMTARSPKCGTTTICWG